MRLVLLLAARDLRQAWQSAGLWLPVAFLLL
ncbi:MAG TPA: heme ABC transporter permease CcmB, partial [Rhizorhapis sp.]|nr:heme ABC transporter permease CcmB [Rhizorhapis sp.]